MLWIVFKAWIITVIIEKAWINWKDLMDLKIVSRKSTDVRYVQLIFLHSPRGKENIFTTAVFRTLPFLLVLLFWMKIGMAYYVFNTIFTVCYFIRSHIHTLSILSGQQRNTKTDCILYWSAHLTLSMDKNNAKAEWQNSYYFSIIQVFHKHYKFKNKQINRIK